MQRLLSQIGRSQRLAIVNILKRSQGLTVTELSGRLDMSYMGIKQHCLDLEKDGYVDTFRRHRGVGRPELLYRLTSKSQDLFPQADNSLSISLLEQARKLFGPSAPGKMLFFHFQKQGEDYAAKLRGETPAERAKWLVRFREKEGHMADFELGPPCRIIERHHLLQKLFEAYPEAMLMEQEMFQRILGTSVKREQKLVGGLYECVFLIG